MVEADYHWHASRKVWKACQVYMHAYCSVTWFDSLLRMQSCLQVIRFPEAVETALEELMPNRLTDYLYDLSDKFNSFYTECKVSFTPTAARNTSRLSVLLALAQLCMTPRKHIFVSTKFEWGTQL